MLNELYSVLKEQLTSEEMDQLRKQKRHWITYRDETVKKPPLNTMDQLEYVAVLANLTEERDVIN